MRFTILSEGGDGIGLALRLRAEGNQVRIFIREPEVEGRGKGLVERAEDPLFGEVLVADCTGMGFLCDKLREHGAKVACGSAIADKLETDRKFSKELMEAHGILTPKSKSFNDWDDAVKFIASSETRLAFKPEGSMSGVIPSYCAKSNEELLESIEHFKNLVGSVNPEFTLEEFIDGTCISCEGWFNGEHFLDPFVYTIERKHFMDGDIGPSGGCTGNLVWLTDRNDEICRNGILLMERFLRQCSYIGPLDLNSVVNEEGVYGLEFTPRFGYDAFPTFLYGLYTGEIGSLLWDIASGAGRDGMDVADRFAAGIRLSIPPWPSERFHAEQGIPIRGIAQERLITDLWPYDIELADDKLVTSGGYGILGVMNASGDTIHDAFADAYRKVHRLQVPDLQFRTDMEEVCAKDYRRLARLVSQ